MGICKIAREWELVTRKRTFQWNVLMNELKGLGLRSLPQKKYLILKMLLLLTKLAVCYLSRGEGLPQNINHYWQTLSVGLDPFLSLNVFLNIACCSIML